MDLPPLSLENIQGDVYPGLPKKAEAFYFFEIADVAAFRGCLRDLVPLIASGADVSDGRMRMNRHIQLYAHLLPAAFVNIAFVARGLQKIGIGGRSLGDMDFHNGMFADATNLGDVPADWIPEFMTGTIDGVVLIAGESHATINLELQKVLDVLGNTVRKIIAVFGHLRRGKNEGHEHFGFLDGVSQPAVAGLDTQDLSGQGFVDPG